MAIDLVEALGGPIAEELESKVEETTSFASYNTEQVIEAAKGNLNFLAGMAMPEVFEYLFPPVLLAAWQLLTQLSFKVRDFSKLALGIPRGHGKTTLIKIFILFVILFTKKRFILIVSATGDLAENILADVMDMLSEPNIVTTFGNWRIGKETERTDLKKFSFRGRSIIIAAMGVGGTLRGLNIKNERPDIMIFEDLQTKECSESQVQSQAVERWMYGTAMKAKSPKGCLFIFCGNMYPGSNSILKKLKSQKSWIKFISGAILADGSALWEELRPLESLIDELNGDIEAGHPEIFFSEVLNDTEAGINSRVDFAQIRAWPYREEELPQGKFILIDPSQGKGLDACAMGYFEVFDGIPGLRRVEESQLSPGNTIRQSLLWALQTGTRCIAIEATAYQASLIYWAGIICDQLGLEGFHFVEIYGNQFSKNARIANGLKSLTAAEIDVHDTCRGQVLNQISNWNPLKRDNVDGILDLIGYATKVVEQYPSEIVALEVDWMHEAGSSQVQEDNHAF